MFMRLMLMVSMVFVKNLRYIWARQGKPQDVSSVAATGRSRIRRVAEGVMEFSMRIIGLFLGLFAAVSLTGAVAALSTGPEFQNDITVEQTLVIDN